MSRKPLLFSIVLLLMSVGLGSLTQAPPTAAQTADAEFYSASDFQADVDLYLRHIPQDDPAGAAIALVDVLLGDDPAAAHVAGMELLRRAGVPLVSPNGEIVALPEDRILEDSALYADLIPQLVEATRRGDFYTPEQLVELIHGMELTAEVLPADALVTGLGAWGKREGAPVESQVAGAAVRALAASRDQVFYAGADLGTLQLDPLQTTLILAHLTTSLRPDASSYRVAPALSDQALPGRTTTQQSDPCGTLKSHLEGRGFLPEGSNEAPVNAGDQLGVIEGLRGELIGAVSGGALGEEAGGTVATVIDRGTKGLNMLILLLGAQLDLSADKTSTHFRHSSGSTAENVHLTATARFDSALAQKQLNCYELAGLSVPPNGYLEGFKVRWNLDQPLSSNIQQGGALLTTVSSDSNKIQSCGTCGEATGANGQSTLELYPATENNPGTGEELTGSAVVYASLDKADFPFKLADFIGLRQGTAGAASFAATKLFDLAINALTRAGLPSRQITIEVAYHGYEIYTAKGEGSVWLFYIVMPVEIDIYSCTGREGPWQGTAGMSEWDVTTFGDIAAMISQQPLPHDFQALNTAINFTVPTGAGEGVYPFYINGWMEGEVEFTGRAGDTYSMGNPVYVGHTDITVDGISLEALCDMLGMCTVEYPIYSVPSDDRCGATNTYQFD